MLPNRPVYSKVFSSFSCSRPWVSGRLFSAFHRRQNRSLRSRTSSGQYVILVNAFNCRFQFWIADAFTRYTVQTAINYVCGYKLKFFQLSKNLLFIIKIYDKERNYSHNTCHHCLTWYTVIDLVNSARSINNTMQQYA